MTRVSGRWSWTVSGTLCLLKSIRGIVLLEVNLRRNLLVTRSI